MNISFRRLADIKNVLKQREREQLQLGDTILYEAVVVDGTKTKMKVKLFQESEFKINGKMEPGFLGEVVEVLSLDKDGGYGASAWGIGNNVQVLRSEPERVLEVLYREASYRSLIRADIKNVLKQKKGVLGVLLLFDGDKNTLKVMNGMGPIKEGTIYDTSDISLENTLWELGLKLEKHVRDDRGMKAVTVKTHKFRSGRNSYEYNLDAHFLDMHNYSKPS